MRRVCDCGSGPERGGDHRSFGHLRVGGAGPACVAAVDIDAIGALSRERNGDGDQLLVLYGNDSVRDRSLIKCPEGLHDFGREVVQFLDPGQVFFGIHIFPLFFSQNFIGGLMGLI